jgi:hypothetical protein
MFVASITGEECAMTDVGMQNIAAATLPVKDRETTGTLYIDGVHGMTVVESMVMLNLTRTTTTAPGSGLEPIFIDTVVRLAIPILAFARIAELLKLNLDELVKQGALSVTLPSDDGK